jgi:hypothetical protein
MCLTWIKLLSGDSLWTSRSPIFGSVLAEVGEERIVGVLLMSFYRTGPLMTKDLLLLIYSWLRCRQSSRRERELAGIALDRTGG